MFQSMANLKTEFHEHLTHPGVKYEEKMRTDLFAVSRLEMGKSHPNVGSFDENMSYLSTSGN